MKRYTKIATISGFIALLVALIAYNVIWLGALNFSPPGPLTIDAGGVANVSVTLNYPPRNATTVTLTSSSRAVTVPPTLTIAANATTGQVTVAAQVGGSATITATASGFVFGSRTLAVNVRPVLSALNPASAVPGTSVTVTGAGFDPSASVLFGNQTAITSFVSPTQLTVTVPNLAPGQTNVTVTVNGQTSQSVTFQILATLLFRTSTNDVQTFSFSQGAFALLDTDPATPPPGGTVVVGIAFNGQTNVLRTSMNDVQNFNLGNNSLSVVGAPLMSQSSGTGIAIAASGNLVVRASDLGLETYELANGVLRRGAPRPVPGLPGGTGVAVDLSGDFAVRGHTLGIDVYDVSSVAVPVFRGRASSLGGQISSVGVGVKFAPGGLIVVRSGPAGIDKFTIAATGRPTHEGSFTGGTPDLTLNTAVAIDATGTRAVRVHSAGIEVYDIRNPVPRLIGRGTGGAASATGAGAFITGNFVFRATNTGVEAYDITNVAANIPAPQPVSIPVLASIRATTSSIGVGLSGR